MNVNETYHVEIVGAASDGRGIARVDGQVLFVPGALPKKNPYMKKKQRIYSQTGGDSPST